MAMLVLSVLILNNGTAQPVAGIDPDKILEPISIKEKRKLPVRLGAELETYVSGNAHGAYYTAAVNLSKGKSIFSAGPCLQKRSLEVNGIKLGYSYLLSGINDRYDQDEINELKDAPRDVLELRVLCFVQYLHKASLSYKASRVETITANESKINFNQVRFTTVEAALCMELDYNIKRFKIKNYMGVSAFYHTDHLKGMYRPKCSPALMFGAGLIIPQL